MNKNISRTFVVLSVGLALLFASGCGGTAQTTNRTALELFALGKKAFDDKKYVLSIEYFQTIVLNHGGVSFVDTAQYFLATSYFENHDYTVAGVEFNRLALNYPSSVYFENAIFMRAVCYFEGTPKHYGLDQTELQKAIDQLEDFIIDFPESELISDARAILAQARGRLAKKYYQSAVVYKRIGAYVAAQKYFQVVIDDYTDSEFAPKALFEFAEVNLKLKKFSEAQAGFENFATIFKENKLAPKAMELAREAAFNGGVVAYDKGDFPAAKERFESFLKDYPDDRRVGAARDYLARIVDKQSLLSEDGHAGS
ncbi:MAG TPA: outer membrane protein assembly factor BamD [candidate division Zixibacteria bacterium]|nr:outer membrane protein assembly factor BamD [candidate division Zixibacteria bacterium]